MAVSFYNYRDFLKWNKTQNKTMMENLKRKSKSSYTELVLSVSKLEPQAKRRNRFGELQLLPDVLLIGVLRYTLSDIVGQYLPKPD